MGDTDQQRYGQSTQFLGLAKIKKITMANAIIFIYSNVVSWLRYLETYLSVFKIDKLTF